MPDATIIPLGGDGDGQGRGRRRPAPGPAGPGPAGPGPAGPGAPDAPDGQPVQGPDDAAAARPAAPAPRAALGTDPGARRVVARRRPERADDGPAGAASAPGAEVAAREDSLVAEWDRRIAGALAFLRRRVEGDYEVDEFGYDPELTDTVLMAPLRPLYEKWFRVEVRGLEHVPDAGGALVVANHSGTVAVDALMTQLALLDHHPAHRRLRMLGADLVFRTPVVGEIARKSGHTLACNPDAERLLTSGKLVGVWPEGFKGIGKPWSERYKLQRFGRGGFVSAALRAGVPIIPTAIVGAEEIYPMIGNLKPLARLLGLPYFPVTPTFPWLGPLGMVPLPSKWVIEFCEPIRTDDAPDGAADDPMLVFNVTDQVRETIQQTLYRLLVARRGVFF